ncbi:hypothetical protein TanjilG_04272 [Lupinus angustifolius]|uniref:Uncharacterized protein n=1 Tax=Lupinus angustifolius TaxID=3871 RepID=A0A4P1RPY3_LUPAN|nr:hypothetical protein TanjilG_04272 [Lupinus angustifolius]
MIDWLELGRALAFVAPSINAELLPHAPAPSPTSDGTAVDQGIACMLMLLALVLTYIIH